MEERIYQNLLFDGISRDQFRKLDLEVEVSPFCEGTMIFEEGDPGGHLYLVLDGQVCISKKGPFGKQETLADIRKDGFFGELALLDGRKRSARATAARDSVLGLMDGASFERFLSCSPETSRHFAEQISGQLRSSNQIFIDKLLQAERLSLLGTMMSSIVHDIRNPIATLGQVGHTLSSREDNPRLLRLGRITEDAVEQMTALIQELLDFSRGTIALDMTDFAAADFVETLNLHLLGKMERAGIEVIREIEPDALIRGDRQRLLRLFMNVIKNAWEAMKDGGTLTLRIGSEGDTIRVEVEDTGCGIEPEMLQKVFEPFVTRGKARGTGLGMAIVKSVIEAHGGSIEMNSQVGEGTTCSMTLPRHAAAAEPGENTDLRRTA